MVAVLLGRVTVSLADSGSCRKGHGRLRSKIPAHTLLFSQWGQGVIRSPGTARTGQNLLSPFIKDTSRGRWTGRVRLQKCCWKGGGKHAEH